MRGVRSSRRRCQGEDRTGREGRRRCSRELRAQLELRQRRARGLLPGSCRMVAAGRACTWMQASAPAAAAGAAAGGACGC
jgi:hypothetical protein